VTSGGGKVPRNAERAAEHGHRPERRPAEEARVDPEGRVEPVRDDARPEGGEGGLGERGQVVEVERHVERQDGVAARHERHPERKVDRDPLRVAEVQVARQTRQGERERVRVLDPRPQPDRRAAGRHPGPGRPQLEGGLAVLDARNRRRLHARLDPERGAGRRERQRDEQDPVHDAREYTSGACRARGGGGSSRSSTTGPGVSRSASRPVRRGAVLPAAEA